MPFEISVKPERQPQSLRPKANLDFLRSLAVLFVLVDHTSLALGVHRIALWDPAWLGNFGVFMFFIHTTLVLMWSIERRPHALDFYIRRVFRIYPLALLAIAVELLTKAPTTGTVSHFFGRLPHTSVDVFANCLLIQNLAGSGYPLVNVMGTLPFEVEMYVALPLLFAFAWLNRRVWPLLLLWFVAALYCRHTFADPNTVNLAVVIPMFLPGVMAYVLFGNRKPFLSGWMFTAFLAIVTFLFMHAPTNRQGWLCALVLGLALPLFKELRSRWIKKASHYLAQYSYGIYLSHPFGLVLGMYLLRSKPLWMQLVVEILTICIASLASYHLLEAPMIRLGSRLAGRIECQVQSSSEIEPNCLMTVPPREMA